MQLYFIPKQRKQHTRRIYFHPDLPEIGIYYPETDQFLCQPYWYVAVIVALVGVMVYGSYIAASTAGYTIMWAAAILFFAFQAYSWLFPIQAKPTDAPKTVEDAPKTNFSAAPVFLLMEYSRAMSYTVWTPPDSVGQPSDIGLQMSAFMVWSPIAWYITFLFAATAFAYLQYVLRKAYWSA